MSNYVPGGITDKNHPGWEVLKRISAVIRDHLTQQKCQSMLNSTIPGSSCAYRGRTEGGRVVSCAVGCLINDQHYEESFEGSAVDMDERVGEAVTASLLERELVSASLLDDDHFKEELVALLARWQEYHDGYSYPADNAYPGWLEGLSDCVSPEAFHRRQVETHLHGKTFTNV